MDNAWHTSSYSNVWIGQVDHVLQVPISLPNASWLSRYGSFLFQMYI